MKKIFLLIFFIATNFAFAQFDFRDPTSVTLNGGFFLPFSSEVFKTGINIGLDVQHKIDPIYIYIDLAYNASSRKNNNSYQDYENTSSTSITELLGGARIFFAKTNLNYFLDLGIGFYLEKKGSYTIKENGIKTEYPSESNTTFGGNFGVGAEYPLSKDFDFVAKAKYNMYFGVGNDPFLNTYFCISGGIKYNIKL
jgi:hypothetical protein